MSRKKVVVKMVTAAGCERCKEVMDRLMASARKVNVTLSFEEFDSSTQSAVELGIVYGLDDVPSFVICVNHHIDGKAFCGTAYSDEDVEKVMVSANE